MNHLPSFTAAFYKYGFTFKPDIQLKESDVVKYGGNIVTDRFGTLEVEFHFKNSDLIEFPSAYLQNRSVAGLEPYIFPHLDCKWKLCYEDGSRDFDVYNPYGVVNFCISSVKNVLEYTPYNDIEEIWREFRQYWCADLSYHGDIQNELNNVYLVDKKVLSSKENIWGHDTDGLQKIRIFDLEDLPILNADWPPTNFESIKAWLKDYEIIFNDIKKAILDGIRFNGTNVLFRVKSRNLVFGFFFGPLSSIHSNGRRPVRSRVARDLFASNTYIVKRIWVDNYSKSILLTANTPKDTTLDNKKILLLGLGTIGSNLAPLIIRNGAGNGPSGRLQLIDNDIYEPYNLSRHYLGIKATGYYKTEVLKYKLLEDFPFSKIDMFSECITQHSLKGYDLILDTTGEIAITTWLAEKILSLKKSGKESPDLISIWIKGQGQYVQSYLVSAQNLTCHQCIKVKKYSSDQHEDIILRDSCRSVFIPFPISASLYASLLGVHVLKKWLKNDFSSNFFEQKLDPVSEITEESILPMEKCLLCG
ncbi:ThiF family adenylyltransferase [Chitinispirillales bacterium ANBcel5]|uniref:ThiF family adenylyltransferase n=1 Tax=Cellulosispirillum alkaliphilum TaxID=3039283 RepID=UPI002A52AC5F|nr:ThiF family adenylyltransferase [Chitinispirillales bacterium ANBcel5]